MTVAPLYEKFLFGETFVSFSLVKYGLIGEFFSLPQDQKSLINSFYCEKMHFLNDARNDAHAEMKSRSIIPAFIVII